MPEFDMIMMSLVIFVPTAFALILMIPGLRSAEAMRWISLFGTVQQAPSTSMNTTHSKAVSGP